MLRFLKYAFLGWLVLSVVTAPLYWPYLRMVWVFNPRVAAPEYDPPVDAADARRQDLDYLATLTAYDRAFDEAERAAFADAINVIENEVETLSDAEFYLAVSEAVALADNGHTNVSYRPRYTDFNTIDARFYAFSDGLFIVSVSAEIADHLGRQVVGVDGISIAEATSTLRPYRGGNDVWRDLYSTLILESPQLLNAAGLSGDPNEVSYDLATDAGDPEPVVFTGRSVDEDEDVPRRAAWQSLVPDELYTGGRDWVHVLDEVELPRYLTQTDEVLSYALEGGGLYIRALPGFKAGDRSIKGAYKAMLSEHADGSLDYLVVDFRLHDGGDYTKSMDFAKAAPDVVKPDGDIYIITGPNTFSAAIVTVAMLKYYSGDRAIIVGEQMGDRERFWAERGTSFRLPNSGYYVNYATGYHDWDDGCKGEPYCYTLNEMHEVPAGSLSPSVVLEQSFESYRNGEDVILDWVKREQAPS